MAIVVALTGILAVAAIPALASVNDTNAAAGRAEIERQVVLVRAQAFATGKPHGLAIIVRGSMFQPVSIASTGARPSAARDALGNEIAASGLSAEFSGSNITGFVNGDGTSGDGTLWFGYDGAPQIRNASGAVSSMFGSSAVVSLSGGFVVRVSRSGAIDR